MKKSILITLALFVSFAMSAKETSIKMEGKLEMRGDSLFLVDEIGECLVDPTEVIVKLKDGNEIKNKELKILRKNRLGYIDIAVPEGKNVQDFVADLDESGEFSFISYNLLGKLCATSNDPDLSSQWYLNSINVFGAWNYTMGSPSVKVAVIDDLIPFHNDLDYRPTDGYGNIDYSLGHTYYPQSSTACHGLNVAYIISGKTNNSYLGAGVAGGNNSQGAVIIPFDVTSSLGSSYVSASYICYAIVEAVDAGAKIINMSIIFDSSPMNLQNFSDAISYAYNNGVTLVAGSGNSGSNSLGYPSSDVRVISVGSVSQNNTRSTFSSYGANLAIMAPGENISLPTIQTTTSGTSFTSAQVSGVAALMLSVDSTLTPSQIKRVLINTATKLSGYTFTNGYNSQVGYGKVNAQAAVELVAGVTDQALNGPIMFYAPSGASGYWASSNSTGNNSFYLYDDNSWMFDRIEAKLYKLNNNFVPSQLVDSWNNISQGPSIPGYPAGWYLFMLRGYNELGYTDWIEEEVEVVDIYRSYFQIDYDPSSEKLIVSLCNPSSESSSIAGKYEIQIWNSISTQMIRSYRTDLTTFQVSLAGLQKGIYIIRVIKDGKTTSKKIAKGE